MILVKVEYEFFAFEEVSSNARELNRQIRLLFADSATLYVSWTWERQHAPDSEPYSIAYSESSYFTDSAAHVIDASASPPWTRHIGRDVELLHTPSARDSEYQVLEIRSGQDRTYLCSLGCDRVGISETPPT